MFKFSMIRTRPLTAERPLNAPETDLNTKVWPPALVHQVPPVLKKKPIFKEPVLQSILFLSMFVIPALEFLHLPFKVIVFGACFLVGLDVALFIGVVWKAGRAKRK